MSANNHDRPPQEKVCGYEYTVRRGDSFFRAPDVWIASYPGKIPGSTRALAPPSFAVIPGKS